MAEVLKKFEFPKASAFGNASHDWATLFDGKIRKLVKGTDFESRPENFASTARWVGAYKHYVIVKTHVEKDEAGELTGVVILQATPMTDEQRDAHDAKVAERKAAKESKSQEGEAQS